MSDDTPKPESPEPDPFEELLRGASEPAATEPAAAPEPTATPEPDATPTGPAPDAEPPTIVMPGAAAAGAAPGWSLGDDTAATAMYPAAAAASTAPADRAPTAATTVLPSTGAGAGAGGGGEPPSRRGGPAGPTGPFGNRRLLMWLLIGAAALLVVVLVILLSVFAAGSGGQPEPTASPTSTTRPTPTGPATPTRTPSPTPTVQPAIQSFVADPMVVQCPAESAVVTVQLSWSTVGASEIAVASAAALTDALENPYQNNLAPVVENFAIPYSCGNPSWVYTLTIAGADKEHRSSVVTVTRLPFPSPTPNPTPPPAPPAPTISSFTASPATVTCVEGEAAPRFALEWASTNAQSASIDGPGSAGYDWPSLAPNGVQPDIAYDCSLASMDFALTVTGQTSPDATTSLTVVNDGWVGP